MGIEPEPFAKDANCVSREIAGETIVVPVRSNVADLDSVYTMNEAGTAIWQLIDGKRGVSQIAEALCEAYDVDPEVAEQDVAGFLGELERAGLIRRTGPCGE